MWVRSEYAGELAVLSAWLCSLLPWSISYASQGDLRLFRLHFLYLFLQFVPGLDLSGQAPYVFIHEATRFPESQTVVFGYQLWQLGAAILTAALALSIVYYVYDERLEARAPVDPVRVMGVLLVGAAVPFTLATYYVGSGGVGFTAPVGVLFMYALGGLLVVVERT